MALNPAKIFEKQWMRYLVVGGGAVAVDFTAYYLLTGAGLVPSVSKATSYVLGALFSFIMNKWWTFQSQGKARGEMVKFASVYATTFGVNVALNSLVLWLTGIKLLAFALATGTSIVLNYLGQKYWVFSGGATHDT